MAKQFLDELGLKKLMELVIKQGHDVDSAGDAIEIEKDAHHNIINVKYDGKTILLDSEGNLSLDLDGAHLTINSEGKLTTRDLATYGGTMTGDIILGKGADGTTVGISADGQTTNQLFISAARDNSYGGAFLRLDSRDYSGDFGLSDCDSWELRGKEDKLEWVDRDYNKSYDILSTYNTHADTAIIPSSEDPEELHYVTIDNTQYTLANSDDFLPLAGGEMTGAVVNNVSSGLLIVSKDSTKELYIAGDTSPAKGSTLILEGNDASGAGAWMLSAIHTASDGSTQRSAVRGYPNGDIKETIGRTAYDIITTNNTYVLNSTPSEGYDDHLSSLVFDNQSYHIIDEEAGREIELTCNSEYKLTATLKDINNNVISSSMIDLPLEEMIVDGQYVRTSEGMFLVLTLKNGRKVRIPLDDLIKGLATRSWTSENFLNLKGGTMTGTITTSASTAMEAKDAALILSGSNNGSRLTLNGKRTYGTGVASAFYVDAIGTTVSELCGQPNGALTWKVDNKEKNILTGHNTYVVPTSEGTSLDIINYITVDGKQYKLPGWNSEGGYLPLSGGTMTGAIKFNKSSSEPLIVAGKDTNDSYLRISSGTISNNGLDGANISLSGGRAGGDWAITASKVNSSGAYTGFSGLIGDADANLTISKATDPAATPVVRDVLTGFNTYVVSSSEGTSSEGLSYLVVDGKEYKVGAGEYVKKTGDTMTGTLYFDGYGHIGNVDNTHSLSISGGKPWMTGLQGATLSLQGGGDGGRVASSLGWSLYAVRTKTGGGTDTIYELTGKPDGTFTWAGKDVLTTINTYAIDSEGSEGSTNLKYLVLDNKAYKLGTPVEANKIGVTSGTRLDYLTVDGTNYSVVDNYVKKVGDTMTGTLTFNNVTDSAINTNSNSDKLWIGCSKDQYFGGFISLNGANNTSSSWGAGSFNIGASKSNISGDFKILRGLPNGSLTWDSKDILHAGNTYAITSKPSSSTTLKYLMLDNKAYSLGTPVTINSEGTSTETIKYIIVDDKQYVIDGAYVKKTGDTMTGNLTFSGRRLINKTDNDSSLSLRSSKDYMYGASLDLYGANSDYPGSFYLEASIDDSGSLPHHTSLIGKYDGTLTWGSKDVLHAGNTYVVNDSEGTSTTNLSYIVIDNKQYKVGSGNYLPLSGGTMTGTIVVPTTGYTMNGVDETGAVRICGGPGFSASLTLFGGSNSSVPGQFSLAAAGHSNTCNLVGTQAGSLTWDNYKVLTAKNTKASSTGTSTTGIKYITINDTEYVINALTYDSATVSSAFTIGEDSEGYYIYE